MNVLRSIAVLSARDPPSEKTLVEDANDTPLLAVDVENCDTVVRQVPLIAKQPVLPLELSKLIPPPWKVEVAVVEAYIPVLPDIDRIVDGVVVPIPSEPPSVEDNDEVAMILPSIVVPYSVVEAKVVEVVAEMIPEVNELIRVVEA